MMMMKKLFKNTRSIDLSKHSVEKVIPFLKRLGYTVSKVREESIISKHNRNSKLFIILFSDGSISTHSTSAGYAQVHNISGGKFKLIRSNDKKKF